MRITASVLFGLSTLAFFTPHTIFPRDPVIIYAFTGYKNQKAEKLLLVGEVIAVGKMPTLMKDSYTLGYDMRPWKVTVRIPSPEGIQSGQKLSIVRKNPDHGKYKASQRIGELTVYSITQTNFSGWILTGTGNFKNISVGDFVARSYDTREYARAAVNKSKGDMYFQRGEPGRAIAEYKKALSLRPRYPAARLALGKVYATRPGNLIAARSELQHAYAEIDLAQNDYVKYQILNEYFLLLELQYKSNFLYNSYPGAQSSMQKERSKVLEEMNRVTKTATEKFPSNNALKLNRLYALFYEYESALTDLNRPGGFNKDNRMRFDGRAARLRTAVDEDVQLVQNGPRGIELSIRFRYAEFERNTAGINSLQAPQKLGEWQDFGRKLRTDCRSYLRFARISALSRRDVTRILTRLDSILGPTG